MMLIMVFASATDKSSKLLGEILPWLILLTGLILAGGVFIFFLRRWLQADSSASSAGFTLQDLRDMHARGELTDEQFQDAKASMIGRLAAKAEPQSKSEDAGSSPGNQQQSSE